MTMTAQRMMGVAASLLLAWAAAASGEIVTVVQVHAAGAVPVDEAMVRSYLGVKAGTELDRNAIAGDVRALLESGRFSDVRAEVDTPAGGATLTYVVRPKLKLTQPVKVTGAEELGESRVRELLGLGAGDYVDDPTVAARVVRLKEEYRKRLYAFASATWSVDIVDRALGLATVTVRVKEGDRTSVRKVLFPGRQAVDYGALRSAMDIPAWYNPLGWFRRTPYDAEELKAGCERVAAVYKERGYLDVKVGEPKIEEKAAGRFIVTIPVTEGILYKLARTSVSGNTIYPEPELRQAAGMKAGAVASMTDIGKAADAIRDYYESRGYMRTGVTPLLDLRDRQGDVDVRFAVREGRMTYVDNVIIRGNSVTRDKVIRREVLVYPGEQFNGVSTRKSENRLRGLNYFSSVTAYDEPTGVSNRSDIVFEVEEQRTGQFTAGAGFSSIDSLIGFAEISQGNFDIRGWPFLGGGQKIKLRAEFGSRREDYSISFVEPWFMDRKLSLGVDLYSQRRNDRDYDILRQGGALSLGVPLLGPNRLDLKYRLEQVETRDASDTNAYRVIDSTEDRIFYYDEPRRTASSLAGTVSHDTRDNFFVPTRGLRAYATGTLMGGPLGFDTELYGVEAGGSYYVPLWWQHVLSFRMRAEVVDAYGDTDEVPLSERLFAGGTRTVRGFRYRWVGPKAERADGTGTIRPCGGQSLALASAEYTIPIVSKIRFATFYDTGNVWLDPYEFDLDHLASGAGIGLRLDIPGFPMRFDYAWPIEKDDPTSRTEKWSFWIGYGF
jgi:outer membrane protein insertion porin family